MGLAYRDLLSALVGVWAMVIIFITAKIIKNKIILLIKLIKTKTKLKLYPCFPIVDHQHLQILSNYNYMILKVDWIVFILK